MGGILSKTQSANLSDMPMTIAYKVLEKMDPTDQLTARKVSRSVRTAIDKIGIRFNKITLKLEKGQISMELDVDKPYGKCIQYRDGIIIPIVKSLLTGRELDDETYVISSCGRSTKIEKEFFVHTACRDLKILLKHASCIEFDVIAYKVPIFNICICSNDIYFVESFAPLLECFHIKEVCFISFNSEYVYKILPNFDATTLKSIELCPPNNFGLWIEKIAQLDQWKNIEEFKLRLHEPFNSDMFVYLLHLQSFTIEQPYDSFPIQNVVQIRDDIMRRSTFQSCTIKVGTNNMNPSDTINIAKVFKPEYAGGDEFEIKYSLDDDKFMIECQKIQLNNWNYYCFSVRKLSSHDILYIKNNFDFVFYLNR